MKKEIPYAVKNVFRRALEAKQDFGGEDGAVPAPVAELCFPAPELAPEVIDDWNRNHSSEDELIDKFIPRNTFVGDFSKARILLLDNCVPAEQPGSFTQRSLREMHLLWYPACSLLKWGWDLQVYGHRCDDFIDFWWRELHTRENTGLLDPFLPVFRPVCSLQENRMLHRMSGEKGFSEAKNKLLALNYQQHFAEIAWFTFDLERFTKKTYFYNYGQENTFVKKPYFDYFKNIKDSVLEKVRRAMAENKVIICRSELALWHREIDFSRYDKFFFLCNPDRPICRGNVGKGCDLSVRPATDPFDDLVNICDSFLPKI